METALPGALDLIPNLGVLNKLLLSSTTKVQRPAAHREIEQLPYYLRGACLAFQQLDNIRTYAAEQFCEISGRDPNCKWVIVDDLWDQMGYFTDFFLTFLRRAMDAQLLYMRRSFPDTSLPRSFADAVTNLEKGKDYGLDAQLNELLMSYWEDTGSSIKGYRDQALHRAIVLSNCVMYFHYVAGSTGMQMLLPDDPKETSPSKMRYEPGVPAMGFFAKTLYETVVFVNRVTERLIDLIAPDLPDIRETYVVSIAARGGSILLSGVIKNGEAVPFTVSSSQIVNRAVKEAQARRAEG